MAVTPGLAPWAGDIDATRALQDELARQLVLRDQFPTPLRTIAGFNLGFEDDLATTRVAVVLLEADTLAVIEQQVVRLPAAMPDIAGLLSFRAMPALLAALSMLRQPPDLAFFNGHGIAHPRRLGIAAHFGVLTGTPSIGVATKILTGTSVTNLHDMRGAFTPLRDGREQIGWLLRSKPGCLPLVVSPGHKVALASAPGLVMRYVDKYRLPEPTRLAEHVASGLGREAASARP